MNPDFAQYLQPTEIIDSDNAAVQEFAGQHSSGSTDPVARAIDLYYAVRDGFRYDPYTIDLSPAGFRASTTLANKRGWCVPKAILLAAVCRAVAIPARLGFADVRNHLSTARMRKLMKTDIFYWHGYTSLYLQDTWIKATPAFNLELCERFDLQPLEFDGHHDSLYQSLDRKGNKHMEYIRQRGEFSDVPLAQILETYQLEYLMGESWNQADFDAEVARETEDDQSME